jgi:hypothetical protein
MAELVMRASRPGNRSRRPRTFGTNRVCFTEGCDTVLSRYNRAEFCHRHAPITYPRLRGVFSDDWEG